MTFTIIVPVALGREESFANLQSSIEAVKGLHEVTTISLSDYKHEGPGVLRNKLLSTARLLGGDVVISLDDDMELTPGFFDAVKDAVELHPQDSIFALAMRKDDVTTYGSTFNFVAQRSFTRVENRLAGFSADWGPCGAMAFTGAALMDPEFNYPLTALGEDVSLYFAAMEKQYAPVTVIKDALVIHKPSGGYLAPSVPGFRNEATYEEVRLRLWLQEGLIYNNLPEPANHAVTPVEKIEGKHYHPVFHNQENLGGYLTGLPVQPVLDGERPALDRWQLMMDALLVSDFEDTNYLDLGCNIGFFCHAMSLLGARSVGVDNDYHVGKVHLVNESPIGRARYLSKHYGLPAVFVEDDAVSFLRRAKQRGYTFDIITAFSIFHHMKDWEEAVELIADRCTGTAFIEIPMLKEYREFSEQVFNKLYQHFSKVEIIGESANGWEGSRPMIQCRK